VSSIKKVLSIRVRGKDRKKKVRDLLLDLAHFRNILIILITKYNEIYKHYPINQSILYGLIAKEYTGKYQEEFEDTLNNINQNEDLKTLFENLKTQKEKVDNPYLIQYIIRQIIKDFKSFFKSIKSYKQNPEKFKGIPKSPKPKKLKYIANFSAEANNNSFKQEENNIIIIKLRNGNYLKVKLPKDFQYRVSSVRLKLFGDDLYIDIVYEQQVEEVNLIQNYIAGIDIGLDEMLSIVSDNPALKSFIVSGKEIKAFNQWFNKERAKLRSEIDYLKNEIKSEDYEDISKLKRTLQKLEIEEKALSAHRKRWLDNNLHKISRKLVDLLYETGHKIIYIGKNALESKNGISLSKKTNQNFVSIPFRRLVDLIKYKAKEYGMEVIEVDESYTSKTSPFADVITIQKTKNRELCNGERKGNFFKDKVLNKVFHADLVGALNILRVGIKSLKLNFYENLKVLFIKLCNPVRMKLIDFLYKTSPESLWIRSSRQDISSAGWTEKLGYLATFDG